MVSPRFTRVEQPSSDRSATSRNLAKSCSPRRYNIATLKDQLMYCPTAKARRGNSDPLVYTLAAFKPKPVYYGCGPKPLELPARWRNLIPACVRKATSAVFEALFPLAMTELERCVRKEKEGRERFAEVKARAERRKHMDDPYIWVADYGMESMEAKNFSAGFMLKLISL